MQDVYNVAIVGCGSMGVENLFENFPFVYSFAGAVFKNPRTKLAVLVDTDVEKLAEIEQKLSGGGYPTDFSTYTTIDDAAAENRIDIVCSAAGPQVNKEVIHKAKGLGLKGAYLEKPLVLSLHEADELARIEKETGLKVQINYLRNFETHHRAVIDYVREGKIGDLLTVRVNYKGGVLAVAPHALAMLALLFDEPLSVTATLSPLTNGRCPEDPNVDGIIRYQFGNRQVHVSLMATGRGDPLENNTYIFELEFTGTEARISILENGWRVRYERMEKSRVFGELGEMMPYDTAAVPLELKTDAPREFLLDGLKELIHAIDTDGGTSTSIRIASKVEEVAHALATSGVKARTIGLPLRDRSHAFANSRAGVKLLKEEQLKD